MKHKSYWNFQVPAFSSVLQGKNNVPGSVRLPLESQKELEGAGDAGGANDQRGVTGQEIRIFILKDSLVFALSAPISLFSALETREEGASGWAFPLPGNSRALGGKDEENSLLRSSEQLERRKKPPLGCRQTQEQREVGEELLLLHSRARRRESSPQQPRI